MTKAQEVLEQLKSELPDMPYYDEGRLDLLWSDYGQISETRESGDDGRWNTQELTVWGFEDGSFLGIEWASGNTEYQENEGPFDIYLVEPYEVSVTKYRKVQG